MAVAAVAPSVRLIGWKIYEENFFTLFEKRMNCRAIGKREGFAVNLTLLRVSGFAATNLNECARM